ncbi:UTP--glucose-1-phosphate uridylyltransferase [Tolypothrix sp. FACHB-123]|uniref:UTP--glucose-1-phosphate uridylyltransferase n=1 Tax=Tolypothrix sp. FACHB-123 TaxID=2692868 RepID=UPI00168395B3|nr:UTP--glucose-1-phosphate uridylyltransferase [Tolypothrix sp. FACHB-123]MBD2353134.1 UTP--glucose-1-phosphate uridylyltransferase [Tolypothrix sp. FACHB-123]
MPINQVRKAVIPAAGFGTRLFPATQVVKKELFPIIDENGRAKPIILAIVEEAISAGITEVGIVVQPNDLGVFTDLFKNPPKPELWQKLSPSNQEYSQYLQELGKKVVLLTQPQQEGYGHAVFCAKDWVQNEPFLLMLGDHVYKSDIDKSCAQQMVELYAQVNQSVVSLTSMPASIINKAGCVAGVWQESNSLLKITQLAEKPSIDYARQHLRVEGMTEDEFLCVFGLYILTPQIFDYLAQSIQENARYRGEFQLTTCLDQLCQVEGMTGYVIKGKYFDTGLSDTYRQTLMDFR